jgi:adenylate cyclase
MCATRQWRAKRNAKMDKHVNDKRMNGEDGAAGWRGDYVLWLEPVEKRIRVEFGGEVIAESDNAVYLHETRHVPVFYFPREDVRMAFLEHTDTVTTCPFKGNASYWTVRADGRAVEDAAWSYETPHDDVAEIKEYVAFYWNRMDAWYGDDERLYTPDREATPHGTNPLMEWVAGSAWSSVNTIDLIDKFVTCLVNSGVPLVRFRMFIRTLHPQMFARAFLWTRESNKVEAYDAPYRIMESAEFRNNPVAAIFEGAGGVRRRLEGPNAMLDYPILVDQKKEGATDYVAMPMTFSDGQINAITMSTDRPGGFSTEDLGHIYEILPLLSRLFEVHYLRRTAVTLLDTYLGHQSGQKVLEGRIKRGDGENVNAIIWFCDLRQSTSLADSMPQADFLALLNDFFEAMASSVLDHGGEVLRFIGDAALAIFPLEPRRDEIGTQLLACERAIAAARDAEAKMAAINAARAEHGKPELEYGIALHMGDVMYGNIGSEGRLEFTVIGAAANEAARIEGLTKTLGETVLVSRAFRECYPGELISLGKHPLRGVREDREVFTLPRTGEAEAA